MNGRIMDSIKRLAKNQVFLRTLNARWKATATRKEYLRTRAYYDHIATVDVKTFLTFNRDSPISVFFLGTDEMQDRSGILQGLSRRGPLTYFTRADGTYGQNHPGPEPERRRANSERLLELFADLKVEGKTPQVLIAQTWAGYVDPKVLGRIRDKYSAYIVNIGMDDRHQYWGRKVDGEWWGTRGLIPYIDLALTAAPECVEWYRKEGCPALFFPEASDPDIFYPMPELPKIHDVSFIGGRYGIREKIVDSLRRAGIRVTAYGSGWEGGRLETNEVPRLFAQSKIVLGIGTIGHCEDFYALKMRDFDGPMSGSLYLTHDNPDVRLLYMVGDEIVTYRSIEDCIDKAKWLLSHDEERERIAMAGRARASVDHTWHKRFSDLFSFLRAGTALGGPLLSQ
jgi:spore maturation protein CgeB